MSFHEDEVKVVVNVFRDPYVQFIMPLCSKENSKETLEPRTRLDIIHECVIRRWERLQGWVKLEAEKANYYHHIVQTARYWRTGKAELLKGTDLDEALTWYIDNYPNVVWAELYDGDRAPENLTLVEQFLELGKEKMEEQRTYRQDSEVKHDDKKDKPQIAEWEKNFKDLENFWVVLPKFLGREPDFRDTMMLNIKEKGTIYLYFLESNFDVINLKKLVQELDNNIRANTYKRFDLRLMSSLNDVNDIPTEGKNLIIVAAVNNVLHFRIFDGDGKVVVDTDETRLATQAGPIADLKRQLDSVQPPHELTRLEKDRVVAEITSIVVNVIKHVRYIKIDHAILKDLLKGSYYWIANPEHENAQGYEVLFNEKSDPVSGIELNPKDLKDIVLQLKVFNIIANASTKAGYRVSATTGPLPPSVQLYRVESRDR